MGVAVVPLSCTEAGNRSAINRGKDMIKGWYYNELNGRRQVSIDEIATACCVPSRSVRSWFGVQHLEQANKPAGKSARRAEPLFDAGEVVSFLVRNSIPVAPSLLPPNTRKILFICSEESAFQDRRNTFDYICRFFAETSNLLVETSSAGRFADLSVFTFAPDLVVLFLQNYDEATVNTLNLLSNLPEPKTILLLDNSLKIAVEEGFVELPADLIMSYALPPDQIIDRLCTAFRS